MSKERQAGMVDLQAEVMEELFVVWQVYGGPSDGQQGLDAMPEMCGTFTDPRRAGERAEDLTEEEEDDCTYKVVQYRIVAGVTKP